MKQSPIADASSDSVDQQAPVADRQTMVCRLRQMLSLVERGADGFVMLFIDLDRFAHLNESLGVVAGDAILAAAAERIRSTVRVCDEVFHFASDEFVVLVPALSAADAGRLAARLLDAIGSPFVWQESQVRLRASIGMVRIPEDGRSIPELFACATAAARSVKQHGGHACRFYDTRYDRRRQQALNMEREINRALREEEFRLYLQPKYDLDAERIMGAEALVRWHHPEKGVLSPARFIPVAEQSGQIWELGAWVLEQCCILLDRLHQQEYSMFALALNVSAVQFIRPGFVPLVDRMLGSACFHRHNLELEITESTAMKNGDQSLRQLQSLNALGVSLAMDDFGTGYSNLAYLRSMPFDVLKIDASFVGRVGKDPDSEMIVETLIRLAHGMGLKVVAEGVETGEQKTWLKHHGCDAAQGYFFARPQPAEQVLQMICGGF